MTYSIHEIKKKLRFLLLVCLIQQKLQAQDTTLLIGSQKTTLPEVFVRNHFNFESLLHQIQNDTTFYKAFKNLHLVNYTSLNNIEMFNKKGNVEAALYSKTKQTRSNKCRTMQTLEEKTFGNMYNDKHELNYTTAQLYASLFFTKGRICGENNIVGTLKPGAAALSEKKGIDKHKEQLKMLFFNPGKKIPGIPFIGNKLDVYDEKAHQLYDYRIEYITWKGIDCYRFSIKAKDDLNVFNKRETVVDEMVTVFDCKTLSVQARNYRLSYSAGIYNFDVQMEVELGKVGHLYIPTLLRYKGNWHVLFKQREIGVFTATLYDFSLANDETLN